MVAWFSPCSTLDIQMETPEQLEGFPASCEAGAMMQSGPLIPVHKAAQQCGLSKSWVWCE